MSVPTEVASKAEWDAARMALLVREKQLTRARDALAAERRRLPIVRMEKEYRFEGPDGEAALLGLFQARQETWQDAPAGAPQDRAGSWTRRSDEYTPEQPAGGRS